MSKAELQELIRNLKGEIGQKEQELQQCLNNRSTRLTLNPISDTPIGTMDGVKISGKLESCDLSSTCVGLNGQSIVFTGTAAANIQSAGTRDDGSFGVQVDPPSTVGQGWTIQAHFSGSTSSINSQSPSQSEVRTFATLPSEPEEDPGIEAEEPLPIEQGETLPLETEGEGPPEESYLQ